MLFRTRGGVAVVTILAAAGALAAGGASCAQQGQGTNATYTDGSADGTQQEEASGSSSGSASSSGSSSGGGGCDADIMGDPYNCGACGHHCPQGNVCNCAQCMAPCEMGMATCCGGCADLMTDPNNCGSCKNVCPSTGGGIPECVGGQCAITCPDAGPEGGAIVTCGVDSGSGPGCFDPKTSPQACGGCGNVCASGSCSDGFCADASAPTTGYTTSTPNLPFIDACSLPGHSTTAVSQPTWYNSGANNLPFSFTFFGTPQSQFFVGSQGTLFFGPVNGGFPPMQPSDCTTNWPAPTFPPPDPSEQYAEVLAFADQSMATGPNGVCYGVVNADAGSGDGGGGNQFVVTWSQATLSSDPGSVLTFSIVLTQGTNTIDFIYETATGADGGLDNSVAGVNAGVGLQSLFIKAYAKYSCSATFLPSTPFSIRFTPM